MELPQIDDYQQIFINDVDLLDVRAPVEFEQGAFPHAKNLPLINDEERHSVGIRYKEAGQQQAIELGHELVSGETKEKRIADWSQFTRQYQGGCITLGTCGQGGPSWRARPLDAGL